MKPEAIARVVRAIAFAAEERDGEARIELDRAIASSAGDPAASLLAARVLFAMGDVTAAMEHVQRASEAGAASALDLKFELENRLGRFREAVDTAWQVVTADPGRASMGFAAANLLERRGAWEKAHLYLRIARKGSPPSPRLALAEAHLLVRLGSAEEAKDAFHDAIRLAPTDLACRLEAMDLCVRSGDLAYAQTHACQAIAMDPTSAHARVAVGTFCLWALDLDGARTMAEDAYKLDPSSAAAVRLGGAVLVRERRYEEAITALDEAVALDPRDAEALVWRGEARLRLGQWDAALIDFDRASLAAGDFLLPARALRLIARARSGSLPAPIGPHGAEEMEEAVRVLCPEIEDPDIAGRQPPELAALLELVVERLGGNRTITPTRLDVEGRLHLVRIRPTPRAASRSALELIQALTTREVFHLFKGVIADHPSSPLPLCHRGELHLWLGNYAEAREDLEAAISVHRFTRWAYIGLAMVEIVEGRYQGALDACERGIQTLMSSGTSIPAHRGEAYRRLGKLDEARSDLERACELHPGRVSAWMNLALVHGAANEHGREAEIFARLLPCCVGLFADAAAELGIGPLGARDVQRHEVISAVLEKSLAMMRGNRSSTCQTYVDRSGKLRTVPHAPPVDLRRNELLRVRGLLGRGRRSQP